MADDGKRLGACRTPFPRAIALGDLRPDDQGPLPVAFNFPQKHSGFGIYVYASSEESISPSLVWEYHVLPWTPKP
jgi:hypothetical protein